VASVLELSAPVASALVAPHPVESVPVESVPVESVPVESVPVESVPVESVPVESVPAGPAMQELQRLRAEAGLQAKAGRRLRRPPAPMKS
jgi:hypothetical protein